MSTDQTRLEHLKNCVPQAVPADKLSLYTIALEGWRRGLSLTFFNIKYVNRVEVNYKFLYQDQSYSFAVSKGPDTTKEAMKICNDKNLTKEHLINNNVPTPIGKYFGPDTSIDDIFTFVETIGYPLVVKPSNSNLGQGVIPNINNESQLLDAIKYVRNDLDFSEIIVEKFFSGEEYRVYVVGEQVIGAINRVPAYIEGDGKHSIRELIKQKNKERNHNPNLKGRPIKFDMETRKYIEQANYKLSTVLPENEILALRKNSNVSSGGEPIDVTDHLSSYVKEVAVKAVKAIPGLAHGGVDIMVDQQQDSAAVIEINTRAGIGSHLYPVKGQARDVPKAIIDYYFPDTKEPVNEKLYFDYKYFMDILSSGVADEVKIPDAPNYPLTKKKIIIKGDYCKDPYYKMIKEQALIYHLHGYVKNLKQKVLLVVVAGKEEAVENMITYLKSNVMNSSDKDEQSIMIQDWDKTIKIGFDIRKQHLKKMPAKKTSQKSNAKTKGTQATPESNITVSQKVIRKIKGVVRKVTK
ncbi:ATP-grasp domain-containing protein [Gracilibacillus lacisalsi]|uniref:ATP-grasp domain-containing protein n=1 Tax=Gracilibacillus lacisalsi TaxID=393087 RepID=UPI00036A1A6A|nr:ATP-grasp domain-containing protein [Gracilibacillus lacisalsi]